MSWGKLDPALPIETAINAVTATILAVKCERKLPNDWGMMEVQKIRLLSE